MFDDCKSLNDIARKFFGTANYTNREKSKELLFRQGIDWKKWLEEIKISKEKHCIVCGKKLEKEQVKFCSHSCSAKYNNHKRTKRAIKEEEKEEDRFCKNCGKILLSRQKNFCSTQCQQEFLHLRFIERWKNGEETGLKGEYCVSNHIRRYLFEKNNCKCEMCGWGETNKFTGSIPLEVHHKDGDYTNNKEENLQLLCPNCHSLTETFKSHNKSGRKGRSKYS